jgi:hypothetical protein
MAIEIQTDSLVVATAHQLVEPVAGGAVLLHLTSGIYYSLDDVGARIRTLVEEPCSPGRIAETILSEYNVAPERCQRDVLAFLHQLADNGLVELAGEPAAEAALPVAD